MNDARPASTYTDRCPFDRAGGASRAERRKPARRKSWIREYAAVGLTALLLAFAIRSFVVQAFRIPSSSMEDTLLVGDFLLVNKFLYGAQVPLVHWHLPAVRKPHRGDIIVFRAPHVPKDFIKRCVAVEGDKVEVRNNVLYVNDQRVEEPFLKLDGRPPSVANYAPHRVPPGHLFMLGDNRNNSQDSRYWGMLSMDRLKGKAFVLYWSWDGEHHRPRFSRIGHVIH